MDSKIIDKLKKLIKHKDSAEKIGSLQEAEAFAGKISQLLIEYKLEMSDINLTDAPKFEPVEQELYMSKDQKQRRSSWKPYLANVVARAHFCRVLTHQRSNNLTFIGTASDKAFAIYAFEVLCDIAEEIAERKYRELYYKFKQLDATDEMRGYKKNFYAGFVQGIKENYRVQRQQFESNPNALMVLNKSEEAITQYYQRVPRGRATDNRTGIGANQMAYGDGMKTGQNAKVNRGLTNSIGQKLVK